MTADGIGLLVHDSARPGESPVALARRLADLAARPLARRPFRPRARSPGRARRCSPTATRWRCARWGLSARRLAPDHPSWIEPLGTHVRARPLRPTRRSPHAPSSLRAGPLRVAVLANADSSQAEAAARAVDRWVARRAGEASACPAVNALAPARPGTYAVDLAAGCHPRGHPGVRAAAGGRDARDRLARWTAAALDGPDGLLARALGEPPPGRVTTDRSPEAGVPRVVGTRAPALAMRVSADDATLDTAVAQTRALLDRLRQGALRDDDRARAGAALARAALAGSLDPAGPDHRALARHARVRRSRADPRRAPGVRHRDAPRRRARRRRGATTAGRATPLVELHGPAAEPGAPALTTPPIPAPPGASAPREPPWFVVGDDRVRLLRDGVEAFPAMLDAIAKAEREILLEMYWVGADAVGERFRDALAARARAGVRVCVVYDAIGSLSITPAWWQPLFTAGGRAVEYHSISPLDPRFRLERVERRDHRKLLVVDGRHGFTGGINLAAAWLPPDGGGVGWRDDAVEIIGEAPAELRNLFFRTWRVLTRERPPLDARALPRKRTRPVWVLASQWRTRRGIHREYVRRIFRARQQDRHRQLLLRARPSGPGGPLRRREARRASARPRPREERLAVVQYAVEALFDTLLRHGVEIWALPGTMLHAKTAIIDEQFTTIGSYNLDERSWRKNLEVNLAVEDEAFARHVRSWFERDLEVATRVELTGWRDRPVARRGLEWAALAMRRLW